MISSRIVWLYGKYAIMIDGKFWNENGKMALYNTERKARDKINEILS